MRVDGNVLKDEKKVVKRGAARAQEHVILSIERISLAYAVGAGNKM